MTIFQHRLALGRARLYEVAGTGVVLLSIGCAGKPKFPTSPTADFVIHPATAVLQPHQAAHFSVITAGGSGSHPSSLVWTATGGAINSSGLYQAGSAPGSYRVMVRDPASGKADTSFVAVRTPPNPVTDPCGNEPPGLVAVAREQWATVPPQLPVLDAAGWSVSSGGSRLSVVTDSLFPRGSRVLEGLFPSGMAGGGGPFHIVRSLPVLKTLYQCFWLNVLPGYTNNGNTGTKLAFVYNTYTGSQDGSTAYLNLFGGAMDTGTMGVNTEGPTGFNRNMRTSFQWSSHTGEWHQFEFLIVANSQATADGILQIWVDGVEDTYLTNVKWFPDQLVPTGFNHIDITPTYGGGYNPVPYDMFIHVGDWYISGQ